MRKIASPQDLQVELRRLLAYSQGKGPSRDVLAMGLRDLADRVAANLSAGDDIPPEDGEPESDSDLMYEFLDSNMKKLKKRGWWLPSYNLVVNSALMGINFWVFTIMPFNAGASAYRPATARTPEGIVIDPHWVPKDSHLYEHDLETAKLALKLAKSQPSVHDSVREELGDIEHHFGIKIPSSIAGKIEADAAKVAARRWGIDGLRRKKILVPFDGSKPLELGSYG